MQNEGPVCLHMSPHKEAGRPVNCKYSVACWLTPPPSVQYQGVTVLTRREICRLCQRRQHGSQLLDTSLHAARSGAMGRRESLNVR